MNAHTNNSSGIPSAVTEHATSPSRPWMLYNSRSDYAASAYWTEISEQGVETCVRAAAAESNDVEALTAWCERQAADGAAWWSLSRTVADAFLAKHIGKGARENFPHSSWDRKSAERTAERIAS